MKFYERADSLTYEERKHFGIDIFSSKTVREQQDIKAIRVNEFRAPRRGEWYLSGAIVHAYRAVADLNIEFPIAKLVRTKTETVTTISIV